MSDNRKNLHWGELDDDEDSDDLLGDQVMRRFESQLKRERRKVPKRRRWESDEQPAANRPPRS